MNASSKAKRPPPFPEAKIKERVAGIMPKGKGFELRVAGSLLPNLKVVRVVTEAWKRQPNTDRILKIIKAVRPALTEEENDRILRFSVLTPAEYAETVESSFVVRNEGGHWRPSQDSKIHFYMLGREEKKRRQALLQPILEKAQKDAEARMPISKRDLKDLLDAVDDGSFTEREGSIVCLCDHTLRCTREFLCSRSLSEEQIIPWLAEHGGHCDCEVVHNVGECWDEKIGRE